ncbi:4-hydroxy-2-ketovalerate aldolase [Butyrivibrio sp. NC2007]|uniref:4-hydroxy-2-ketovalerate aldolase n=1 Tax=Butyrivibrio sp. NC2007 TaxID=1280683 RepID=UPI0003B3D402|nr:4-hydroxy-2-ketovalerate aldolase [Butyrivibrio sp. NC2007]
MNDNPAVRILDCTLRDGGHIVDGYFGEEIIRHVIKKLVEAKVDIIEVGFLWETYLGKDYARYHTIADVKRVLPDDLGNSKISLMADYINLDHLEDNDGTVDYIRLSFKRFRREWAWKTLKTLQAKGYKCFINPVNCNVYSDEEYLEVIKEVNELKPYGFSIVDTFGVMRLSELSARYYLVENNLDKDIVIGVHLHENLGLAYSLAQHFINIHFPKRRIVIDGSLLGMGRVPGNLCIEQIMDHLNANYGTGYVLNAAYDAIDDCVVPIKNRTPWGYTIPYALSAQARLHRTYAEYLMKKWRLKTSDIQNILMDVPVEESELFNQECIENLYRDYLDVKHDDSSDLHELQEIVINKDVVVIAPGKSISSVENKLKQFEKDGAVIFSVNFTPGFCNPNFSFFTSIKRMEIGTVGNAYTKRIITSNLIRYNEKYDFAIEYGKLAYHKEAYSEDSTLMLIHLLQLLGCNNIKIAGFDGFTHNSSNYFSGVLERLEMGDDKNKEVIDILRSNYKNMKIDFITPSAYKGYEHIE